MARFETWDAAGRDFDAVVAGTAWHWIDPVAGAAKAARLLRPTGRLAAFWHVFQLPAEVMDAFVEVYRRAVRDSPLTGLAGRPALDVYQVMFDKTADGMRLAGAFTEPEQWRYDWEHHYTRDEWLDQMPTHGGMTNLPPDKAEKVLDGVGAAVDALGGGFTLPYITMAVTASRTG